MIRNPLRVGALVCVVLCFPAATAIPRVAAAPLPPDETHVLERLVGTWDTETVLRPAEWTPREVRRIGRIKREWVLGGRFVEEQELKKAEGAAAAAADREGLALFTYDPAKQVYRMWQFESNGSAVAWTGRWDAAARTLSWRSDGDDGLTFACTFRFADDGSHQWTAVVTGRAGKVYYDGSGKCTRPAPVGKDG